MTRLLLLIALALLPTAARAAPPACDPTKPNSLQCQHEATTIQPDDILYMTQTAGPTRANETVWARISHILALDYSGSPVTAGGVTQTLGTWMGYLAGQPNPNPMILSPSVAFTNIQSNAGLTVDLNGLNIQSAFQAQQGGNNMTSGLVVGVLVPSTSTVYQVNGIAGFIESNAAAVSTGGYVGGYFQAVATSSGANMFGVNTLAADTAGLTGVHLQNELDFNVHNASTIVSGLNMFLAGSANPTNANAFNVLTASGYTGQWGTAFYSADNAAFQGMQLGVSASGDSQPSQAITLRSRNSGGIVLSSNVKADAFGNVVVTPASGGVVALEGNVTVSGSIVAPSIGNGASALQISGSAQWSANGSVGTTMTSLGPTGSHTTVQEWFTVTDNTNTTRFIPAY